MNFEFKKLGTISEMKYGKMPKRDRVKEEGQYPVYSGYRIVGYYDEYNLAESTLVVVARGVGGTGDVKISPEKCYLTNLSISVEVDESVVLKEYLYYYFQIHNLRYLDSGSAQSQITISDLRNVEVPIPDIIIQRKIVEILKIFDTKVATNEAINRNLHEQVNIIIKNCLMDNRITNKKTVMLEDYCTEIVRGYNPNYVELSNRPILNQKVNKGDVLEKQYYKYNDENVIVPDNKLANFGDVLLNSLGQGTLGRVHLYSAKRKNVIIDQFITILRTNAFSKSAYLAYYLQSEAGQADILAHITGSTGMWVLSINNIRSMKIICPSDEELMLYEDVFRDIYNRININFEENEKLEILRDTILPRLMSGELDVSDLEI